MGGRERGDVGGDAAQDALVRVRDAEEREFVRDRRDEPAARAARGHLIDEGEVVGGAALDRVRGERVAARVLADARTQGRVLDEPFEVGRKQRVRARAERDFDDAVVGQLRVPAHVGDDGADARGHDAAEARAGFADGALAHVERDFGLRDAPLELLHRDVTRDLDPPLHAVAADQLAHVEEGVGVADQGVAEAVFLFERGERAQGLLDALAGGDEAEVGDADFAVPGGLFVALRGGRADGHLYVRDGDSGR